MIVQGYIIFFIFIFIMLFVEIKFLPLIITSVGASGGNINVDLAATSTELMQRSFFILLIVQAAFAGLVIGKLSEGTIKKGIKHSIILLIIAYLSVTLTRTLV